MEFTVELVDILYVVLILLVLVFIYVGLLLAGILRDVKITTEKIREVAEIINYYFWQPVHLVKRMYQRWSSVADYFTKRKQAKAERKRKKKRKR